RPVRAARPHPGGLANGPPDTPTESGLPGGARWAGRAGAAPAETVWQAVQSRDLNGARDIPAVIDARMRQSVNAMAPQPAGRWADRVPLVADAEIRDYLGKLATLMDERRERIGQHASQHQPAWAVKALGP